MAEVKKEHTVFSDAHETKKEGTAMQPDFDNMTNMIEGVLRETRDRFQAMSDQIIYRIDEMTKRVDSLEKSITELMGEADDGVQQQKKQQQQ
uniref:Heat shock factor binding protein 1 n=1 Tax=Globodera rostochiensis TaxID=31243 RepID=A0A914I6N6_GLORO